QAADLDHRGRWADAAEEFAVRFANFLPVIDVDDVYPRSHDVGELAAELFNGSLNVSQGLGRLSVGIANADDAAIGAGGRRSRDEDAVPDANGAGIADDRLPRRAGGK